MKKTQFKKITSVILATVILAVAFGCFASAAELSETGYGEATVSNEYLAFCVDAEGYYTIGTTGGNPGISSDDNKYMLYDHGDPWSSYITFVVDGKVYCGKLESFEEVSHSYDAATGSYTTTYKADGIEVKQILTIVDNNSTGREDVVEIKCVVKNTTASKHDIGFRIFFDTMLADNDDAPFRVPGTGDVITETEYEGDDIPQYWQAFDSLTDPTTIAQGTFIRAGYRTPDKVQFVNWSDAYDTPWNYKVTSGKANGDSGVTVVWNEKELAAGQTETFVTYYGLSELKQVSKELSLSLYTDAKVDVVDGEYTPNPTVATAYVKNTSDEEIDNVVINLTVDSILSTETATVEIGTLAPGEEKQIAWNLNIADTDVPVNAEVTATLSGDGVEAVSATRTIAIPSLDGTEPDEPNEPDEPDEEKPEEKKSFFQKIIDFFKKIFALIGLS